MLALAGEIGTTSPYGATPQFSPSHAAASVERFLTDPAVGVFVAEAGEGVCGLLILSLYADFLTGERVAAGLAWYVQPAWRGGMGLRLLQTGRTWAREAGATRLEMVAPAPKFAALFRRLGFRQAHCTYEGRV